MKRGNQQERILRGFLGGILACALLAVSLAAAKDGRDFAGFYELGEITDLGKEVPVPLTVRGQT